MPDSLLLLVVLFVALVIFELTVGIRSKRQLAEVAEALARDPAVLDVRTGLEFRTGHLPGAINMPVLSVLFKARKVARRDQPIIVYCASGTRSLMASFVLRRMGFQEVIDLGPLRNAGKLPRPQVPAEDGDQSTVDEAPAGEE